MCVKVTSTQPLSLCLYEREREKIYKKRKRERKRERGVGAKTCNVQFFLISQQNFVFFFSGPLAHTKKFHNSGTRLDTLCSSTKHF